MNLSVVVGIIIGVVGVLAFSILSKRQRNTRYAADNDEFQIDSSSADSDNDADSDFDCGFDD